MTSKLKRWTDIQIGDEIEFMYHLDNGAISSENLWNAWCHTKHRIETAVGRIIKKTPISITVYHHQYRKFYIASYEWKEKLFRVLKSGLKKDKWEDIKVGDEARFLWHTKRKQVYWSVNVHTPHTVAVMGRVVKVRDNELIIDFNDPSSGARQTEWFSKNDLRCGYVSIFPFEGSLSNIPYIVDRIVSSNSSFLKDNKCFFCRQPTKSVQITDFMTYNHCDNQDCDGALKESPID